MKNDLKKIEEQLLVDGLSYGTTITLHRADGEIKNISPISKEGKKILSQHRKGH